MVSLGSLLLLLLDEYSPSTAARTRDRRPPGSLRSSRRCLQTGDSPEPKRRTGEGASAAAKGERFQREADEGVRVLGGRERPVTVAIVVERAEGKWR